MHKFTVEKSISQNVKLSELVKQITSLQRFYRDMGLDTDNIRTIFAITLAYLKGDVNKLVVKSFFEVLMKNNNVNNEKELNLVNCFEGLVEELEEAGIDTKSLRQKTVVAHRRFRDYKEAA